MSIISIFVILVLAIFATVSYFTEPSETQKRINNRLNELDRAVTNYDGEDDIVKRVTFSSIGSIDRFLRSNPQALKLQLLIEQSNLEWSVGRFTFLSISAVVVGAIIGNWWIAAGVIGWMPGLLLGLAPFLWVMRKKSVRFRQFNTLLPEAIDLISRALRAGHALPVTIEMVAQELPDPMGPEFRRAADELNYGLPFREALLNLGKRVPLPDMRFMVTAILVQKETGGNLAEILDKSAAVLRARVHLEGKVKVHTAQGRMTGVILGALPIICFVAMNLVNPGYARLLLEDETGKNMVLCGIAGLVIGTLIIRRIVRIKV